MPYRRGPGRGSRGTALGTVVYWPTTGQLYLALLCANLMPKRLPRSWSLLTKYLYRPMDESIITPSFFPHLFTILSRNLFEPAPAPRSHFSAAHLFFPVRRTRPQAGPWDDYQHYLRPSSSPGADDIYNPTKDDLARLSR